ncbi:DNA modification methylase [Enterococcus thailandicus]|uniref:DNA modification methylase n=1 Tax=Enterococcus thailandicus TaxID=417368 RepID=UPI0035E09ECC
MINVEDLIPYVNNPRQNDGAVDAVASSIKNFGFKVPIVIDSSNEIVNGHTRLKAARKLGLKEVPAIIADDLTPEQIKAFRLADNKVGEIAEWDEELLTIELGELENLDFDMSEFGFDLVVDDEGQEPGEIVEDDYEENNIPSVEAKEGDIFQLGEHVLMCGDSTNEEHIKKLMSDEKADLVFTDPPYGMKKESDGVANDNLNFDDLLSFNKLWIPLSFSFLKENGSWYCWGIDEPLMDIYAFILKPMINDNLITFRNLLTWDKGSGQGQHSELTRSYATADEKCLFVMCGVQGFNNNSDNYFEGWEPVRRYLESEANRVNLTSKMVKEICGVQMYSHWFTKSQWVFIPENRYLALQDYYGSEAFKKPYGELRKEYEQIKEGSDDSKKSYYDSRAFFNNTHDNFNNVWHFNRLAAGSDEKESAGGHATPKPISLCARAILSSSREGEFVLDLFGGSGSTLITCEQTNRKARLMELEPKWIDVIIHRWEEFTGEKAKKIN